MNNLDLVVTPDDLVGKGSNFKILKDEKIEEVLAFGSKLAEAKRVYLVGPHGFWASEVSGSKLDTSCLTRYFHSVLQNENTEPLSLGGEQQFLKAMPLDENSHFLLFFHWVAEGNPPKTPDLALISLIRQAVKSETSSLESDRVARLPIHQLPTPTAILATDGTILQANASFSRLLGYKAPLPVGGNYFDFTSASSKLPSWIRKTEVRAQELSEGVGNMIGTGGREIPVLRQIKRVVIGKDHKNITIIQLTDLTDIYQEAKQKEKTITEQRSIISDSDHRLQNNLQLVCSLLDYEARSIDTPSIRNVILKIRARISAISLLKDYLSPTNFHQAKVNIDGYLKALSYQVVSTKGTFRSDIELTIETGNLKLFPQRAQHCGLIVHELLANVYDHAFPEKNNGKIVVRSSADKKKNTCRIEVIDNGVGLPEGYPLEDPSSTGFKLIHILLRQLNAELRYEYRDGACFSFQFHHLKKESK